MKKSQLFCKSGTQCFFLYLFCIMLVMVSVVNAQEEEFKPLPMPGGKVVTYTSDLFLEPPDSLKGGDFTIASTPPTIDFAFYPEQTYPGNPLILNVAGTPPDMTVVVKACTDLVDPEWVELGTAMLVDGTHSVTDADWTNYPTRIYCVTPP